MQTSDPAPHKACGWIAVGLVSAAFVVTMLGTTLPTPLYPAFGEKFGFGELMTTVLFAVYPVGVTTALLLFGRWSDQLGRKPLLIAGLVLSGLSAVAFLLPAALGWLFVARVLSGLSAGIFTGTATATIVDLAPAGDGRAGLVAAAANMGGLGLGPLLAGLLAQWAPSPLTLPFVVDLGLIAGSVACVLLVREPVRRQPGAALDLRPQAIRVPREIRPLFVRAAIVGFAGFAVLGLFGAVSPAFLGEVLHETSTAVTGLVVVSVFAASVAGQLLASRLSLQLAMTLGCVGLIVGMLVLAASLPVALLPLLIGGGVVAGFGQGLSFRAGLGSVTQASPPDRRGEISSAFFVMLYVGISIPVVGVGAAAAAFGLVTAGVTFAALVGALAIVVLVLLQRAQRHPANAVLDECGCSDPERTGSSLRT